MHIFTKTFFMGTEKIMANEVSCKINFSPYYEAPNVKLVVLGTDGVGKSTLTYHFISNGYHPDCDPSIEDIFRRQMQIGNAVFLLNILDTAITSTENSIDREKYCKEEADGFIIVYSIGHRVTFNDVPALIEKVKQAKGNNPVPILIVGNQCDLDLEDRREVESKEGLELANAGGHSFMEASAKLNINVEEVFLTIPMQLLRAYELQQQLLPAKEVRNVKNKKCIIF